MRKVSLYEELVGIKRARISGSLGTLSALGLLLSACGGGSSGGGGGGGSTTDTTAPQLSDGDSEKAGTQSLTVDTESGSAYRLMVHFDENIKVDTSKNENDYIEIYRKKAGEVGFTKLTGAIEGTSVSNRTGVVLEKGILVIQLSENGDGAGQDYSLEGSTYKVKFVKAGWVSDEADNDLVVGSGGLETSEVEVPSVDSKAPELAYTSFEKKAGSEQAKLTATFDEDVENGKSSLADLKDDVKVVKKGDSTNTNLVDSVEIKDGKLVVTLKSDAGVVSSDELILTVKAGALKDKAGNATTTESTKEHAYEDTPPTLKTGGDALEVNVLANTLTVSFSEDMLLLDSSKIKVEKGGVPLGGSMTISLSSDRTKLVITLNEAIEATTYQVKIGAGALTDVNGNAFLAADTEIDRIADTSVPLLAPGGNALSIDKAAKTFTVTFSEDVRGTIGVDLKTKVKIWGTGLTIDGTTSAGQAKFASVAVVGGKLVITVTDTVTAGNYRVEILSGALEDLAGNDFAGGLTEQDTVDLAAPRLASTTVDSEAKTITVTFDEEIAVDLSDLTVGNFQLRGHGVDDLKGSSDDTTVTGYRVTVSGRSIEFSGFTGDIRGEYYVRIAGGVVKDLSGNVYVGGDTPSMYGVVLDVTLPALASDALAIDTTAKTFTVTLTEAIKGIVGVDLKTKVKIAGTNGGLSIDGTKPADLGKIASVTLVRGKLVITVRDTIMEGDYTVEILPGALEDLAGNVFSGGTTERDTVTFDTTAPSLASDALSIDTKAKTFTVTLNEDVRGIDGVDLKTKVKIGGTGLTIDGTTSGGQAKIASATVVGGKLVITVTGTITSGNYTVEILSGALEDLAGNDFAGGTTEQDTVAVDTTAPSLVGGGNALEISGASHKTLTISFSEGMKLLDASKVKVLKGSSPLGSGDIASVALKAGDNTKLVITLGSGYTVGSGDYKVTFESGAMSDLADNALVPVSTEADTVVVDTTAPTFASKEVGVKTVDGDADARELVVTFSENVKVKDASKVKLVRTHGDDGTALSSEENIAISAGDVTASGKAVRVKFDPSGHSKYKLVFERGSVEDDAGNAFTPADAAAGTTDSVDALNKAPAFGVSLGRAVNANEGVGGVVGIYGATDANGDSLTYTLEGTNAGLFRVDSSGAVSWKAPAPAHGASNTYSFTVVAKDGFGGEAKHAVTVTVVEVTGVLPPQRVELYDEDDTNTPISGLTNKKKLKILKVVVSEALVSGDSVEFFDGTTSLGKVTLSGPVASGGKVTLTLETALSGDSLHSLTAKVTVAAGAKAGTSSASTPLTFTLDTTPPDAPNMALSGGVAVSGTTYTNSDTPTFNVLGLESGSRVNLYISGTDTVIGTAIELGERFVQVAVSSSLGADGVYSVVAKIEDAAGNESEASAAVTFTLDTTLPLLASDALSIDTAAKTFTITLSEAIKGISGVDLKTKVKIGGTGLTVDGTTSAGQAKIASATVVGGKLVITVTGTITEGNYTVEILSGALEDLAGNDFAGATTEQDVVDATAPSLASDALAIDTVAKTFTITLNEDIRGISGVDLKTKVKIGGTGLTVDGTTSAGRAKITSATVVGGKLVITVTDTITDGNYTVEILSGALEDLAGNAFAGDTTEQDVVDMTGPRPPQQVELYDEDAPTTPVSGLTNKKKLKILKVAVSESLASGDSVEFFDGSSSLGTVTLNAPLASGGKVTLTLSTALSGDSLHSLTAKVTIAAGEKAGTSLAGTPLTFTLDTTPPDAPLATLSGATTVSGTTYTNSDTPTFTVIGLESGSRVNLYLRGSDTVIGTAVASGTSVQVTVSSSLGSDGVYNIVAKEVDAAGNEGDASAVVTFTLDTTVPAPMVGFDSAVVVTDSGGIKYTKSTELLFVFSGLASDVDTRRKLYLKASNGDLSLLVANINGDVVTVTDSRFDTDGTYTVVGKVHDWANNESAESSEFTFTIDRTAPSLASDALSIDAAAKTFTITLNEDIRGISGVDLKTKVKIAGTNGGLSIDGTTSAGRAKIASATVVGGKLVITVTDTITSGNYTVEILSGALEDVLGHAFAGATTEQDEVDATAPSLIAGRPLLFSHVGKTLEISFSENVFVLDAAKISSNFRIYAREDDGQVSTSSYSVSVLGKKVILTFSGSLKTAFPADGEYYVTIAGGVVKDSSGNGLEETTTASSFSVDNTPPKFVDGDGDTAGVQSLFLDTSGSKYVLKVLLSEAVSFVQALTLSDYVKVQRKAVGSETFSDVSGVTFDGFDYDASLGYTTWNLLLESGDSELGSVYKLEIVKGGYVKDVAGNDLEAGLTEGVKAVRSPAFESVVLLGDRKTFELTYSLALKKIFENVDLKGKVTVGTTSGQQFALESVKIEGRKLLVELALQLSEGTSVRLDVASNILQGLAEGGWVSSLKGESVTVAADTTAPTFERITFDDDRDEITVTFSEAILRAAGVADDKALAAKIRLWDGKTSGQNLVTDATVTTIGGRLVLTLSRDVVDGEELRLEIESGALTDTAGTPNGLEAVSEVLDTTPPSLVGDRALVFSYDLKKLEIVFSENVFLEESAKVSSNFKIFSNDDDAVQVSTSGYTVSVEGNKVILTFSGVLTDWFSSDKNYYVEIGSGVVKDKSGSGLPKTRTENVHKFRVDVEKPTLSDGDEDTPGVQSLALDLSRSGYVELKIFLSEYMDFVGVEKLVLSDYIKVKKKSVGSDVFEDVSSGAYKSYNSSGGFLLLSLGKSDSEVGATYKVEVVKEGYLKDSKGNLLVSGVSTNEVKASVPVFESAKFLGDRKTLELTYSLALKKALAGLDLKTKVTVEDSGGRALTLSGVKIAGRKLLVELSSQLGERLSVSVDVAGDALRGESQGGAVLLLDGQSVSTGVDNVSPVLGSLALDSDRDELTVKFSEVIQRASGVDDASLLTKVRVWDGTTVGQNLVSSATVTGGDLVLTLSRAVVSKETLKLEIGGDALTDTATALNGLGAVDEAIDTTPPAYVSLMVNRTQDEITVKFSEAVQRALSLEDDEALAGKIRVWDGSTQDQNIVKSATVTGGELVITLVQATYQVVTSQGAPLKLEIEAGSLEDGGLLHNPLGALSEDVDKTPPILQDFTVERTESGGAFILVFDEKVYVSNKTDKTQFQLLDDKKQIVSLDYTIEEDGVNIRLVPSSLPADGLYSVRVKGGVIKDGTGNFYSGVTLSDILPIDTTAPTLVDGDDDAAGIQSLTYHSSHKGFAVHFSEKMNSASVTKANVVLRKDGQVVTDYVLKLDESVEMNVLIRVGNDFNNPETPANGVYSVEVKGVMDKAGNAFAGPKTTSTVTVSSKSFDDEDLIGLGFVSDADYGY